MTVKYTTYGELKNGDKIYLQGYLFQIENITFNNPAYFGGVKDNTKSVIRFTGKCTADKRNDDIRHTMYNGGVYGGADWLQATLEA